VLRRLLVVLALGLGLLVPAAVPALAEPPFRVDDQLTDRAGVLPGDPAQVRDALAGLRDDGTQLWVVLVPTFDGADGQQWAEQTARESQLGGNDVLFAVATDERAYGYWFDPSSDRDAADVDDVIADDVEPRLADRDWAGAVTALADGLRPAPVGRWVLVVAVVVVLVVGLVALTRWRRRRKADEERRRREDPFPGETTESLQGRAGTALFELDEALRSSQVDLDFGRLQYGEAAVTDATAAIAEARRETAQAFAIRQRLDDETPEADETVRTMLAEILRLAGSADARLDAQAEAFAQLRDLEQHAPQLLDTLATRITQLAGRLPQEETALARLRTRWARSALSPEDDNDEEARARLAAAEDAVRTGREELAAGRPGMAAPAVRTAEDALTQAVALLDAVGRRAREIEEAAATLPAARAEAERDLGEARGLASAGERTGLAEQVARAERALAEVDTLASATPPDPLTALERLQAADRALDEALGRARDEQARQRAARERLDRVLAGARARTAAAADLVETRRGRIGAGARAALSEARRHLAAADAAAPTDAVAAVAEAQSALSLAGSAQQQAEADLSRSGWSSGAGYGWGGGAGFGGSRGSVGRTRSHGGGRRSMSSGGGRRHGGGGRF
jgi:hypothetical protein